MIEREKQSEREKRALERHREECNERGGVVTMVTNTHACYTQKIL
jgi:hypothetical protein